MPPRLPLEGGCDCKNIRYRIECAPLVVHCCHCRWCQRETGSAFAINAMIESDRLTLLNAQPEYVHAPSESGAGQDIAHCTKCHVAVWSHYPDSGKLTAFIRVGTLDQPDALPPNVHIFTESKQDWVILPTNVPAREVFYDRDEIWCKESLERRKALLPAIMKYKEERARRGC